MNRAGCIDFGITSNVKIVKPTDYSGVDCSVASQRKGLSSGTYKCLRIKTQ